LSELQFGFAIPQGWRDDLPSAVENNPVKQYEYSKNMVKTAVINLSLVQSMLMIILFLTMDMI
jgi:hypothetical protein